MFLVVQKVGNTPRLHSVKFASKSGESALQKWTTKGLLLVKEVWESREHLVLVLVHTSTNTSASASTSNQY